MQQPTHPQQQQAAKPAMLIPAMLSDAHPTTSKTQNSTARTSSHTVSNRTPRTGVGSRLTRGARR